MGQIVSTTDPSGRTTKMAWDARGDQTSATTPDGTVTRYDLDPNGNLVAVVENARDGQATDAANVTTTYQFDARNLLSSITDANRAVTSFEYAWDGQTAKETDPLGRVATYSFDLAGRLTTRTAADGVTTAYTYDSRGNLTGRAYSSGAADSFTYDAAGRQTSATNASGTVDVAYDPLGRVTSAKDAAGQTLGYSFDPAGNRTSVTLPDGRRIGYAYDPADRNTTIDSPLGQVATTYDAAGQPTTVRRGDGSVVATTYDPAGQVQSLITTAAGQTLASFAYTYTPNGAVAARTAQVGGQPATTTRYTYDGLGRLTASSGGAVPSTYRYDSAGNLVQWAADDDPATPKPGDAFTRDNTFDAAGQLTASVTVRHNGNTTFTDRTANAWSPTGDLLESVTTAQAPGQSSRMGFAYDDEHRLVAYGPAVATAVPCAGANPGVGEQGCPPEQNKTQGSATSAKGKTGTTNPTPATGTPAITGLTDKATVTSTYDALGRIVTTIRDKTTTTWTLDGLNPIQAKTDTTDLYLRDGFGDLLGQQTGPKASVEWYLADALGSIYGTSANGKPGKTTTDYTDYGQQLAPTGWAFGYSGERVDPAAGIVRYYARAYQPASVGWLQADPYRGSPDVPASLQRHQFVGDNPASRIDILGYAPPPGNLDEVDCPHGIGGWPAIIPFTSMHCGTQVKVLQFAGGGRIDAPIPGASSKGNGNIGYADVVSKDGFVWEIKHFNASNYENVRDAARTQVLRYQDLGHLNPGYNIPRQQFTQRGRIIAYWSDEKLPQIVWYQQVGWSVPPVSVPQTKPKTTPVDNHQRISFPTVPALGGALGVLVGFVGYKLIRTLVAGAICGVVCATVSALAPA